MNKHALVKASKIRKIQEIHKNETFQKIVKTHESLLSECIRLNKGKQFYFYTVLNFIAGFPILNEKEVHTLSGFLL